MSNSSMVSYTKLSPHYRSRNGKKISKITIHHAATVNASLKGMGNGFSGSRVASANYGIDSDGKVGMYVEEKNRAITSSSTANDEVAVTIEVANSGKGSKWPVSDKALNALVELCVDICKRNDIKELNYTGDSKGNLTRHNMFTSTTCPGPYLQGKFEWIAEQVNAKLKSKETTTKSADTVTDLRKGNSGSKVESLQKKLNYIGYNLTVDGEFGSKTESAVKDFQDNSGLKITGVFEKKTSDMLEKVYAAAKKYPLNEFVRDIQKAIGADVDGIAGPETLSKTITVSAKKNAKHKVVAAIQKRLYALGYTVIGSADGKAGSKFTKAVKKYQTDTDNFVDGEITAKKGTWKSLLGMSK